MRGDCIYVLWGRRHGLFQYTVIIVFTSLCENNHDSTGKSEKSKKLMMNNWNLNSENTIKMIYS